MKGKFKDIAKDFGYLNEQSKNTTAGEFEVNVPVQNEKEKVKINLGHSFNDVRPLDDVTISWGDKTYTVDFEFDETLEKAKDFETEDDRFDIDLYLAYSDDEEWKFEVEVQVYPRNDYGGYEYGKEGGTIIKDESAVMWNTLQINTVLSNLANFENKSNNLSVSKSKSSNSILLSSIPAIFLALAAGIKSLGSTKVLLSLPEILRP